MLSWACCLGQGHPKDLANDELTINNNQMQTKTVFGEVTGQTLPTTACSGHAVFGRVCSGSVRTTNIHTKTQSQHFYAKFRRVQASKGMQPKRAKGQHWATRGIIASVVLSSSFICQSSKSIVVF